MFEKIQYLELQGRNLKDKTTLELFKTETKPSQFSMIHGRNGTGKSTMAKVIFR